MNLADGSSRDEKLRKLHHFRQRLPSLSKTALQAVLDAVLDEGVPELHRREHMVQALKADLHQHNAYGPVILRTPLISKTGESQEVLLANSLSLLHGAVSQGGSYTELLCSTFSRVANSPEQPWNLILYADEAVPGNPLANLLPRKCWVLYASFLEFGQVALSKEEAWLTVGVVRSSVSGRLEAGISQVVAAVLKIAFCSDSCDPRLSGVVLKKPTGSIRLFFQLGLLLQDGGAHKLIWCIKADAGCKFCILCKNLFLTKATGKQREADDEEEMDDDPRDGLICGERKTTISLRTRRSWIASIA